VPGPEPQGNPAFAMPVIRRLPETTVNRIAAGEVIERPAAAVKELVENAIDAGARRITIALIAGGIERIEIIDDGCGMTPDDLTLAVERHCTSKLNDESLVRIATLGFRGEALPSIGAAARLSITSRVRGGDGAWRLRVDGGLLTPPEPASGPDGTRIVVEDLFFATPARRKFLKSPRVEGTHAEAAIRRLAMAAPEVAFSLRMDDRVVFDLPSHTAQARAEALLGAADMDGFIPVEGTRGELRLSGLVCGPAVTRPSASGQMILVNGRPVIDPVLRTAVRVAYRQVIEQGRHPVVALYLEIPPEQVDVNVHPAKTELRFADEAAVRALVIGTLQRALGLGAGVAGARPVLQGRPAGRSAIAYPAPDRRDIVPLTGPLTAPLTDHRAAALPEPARATGFAEARLALGDAPSARIVPPPAAPAEAEIPPEHPLGAPVAQVLGTYIIATAPDGDLVLVDQHAAHERLTHEALRAQYLGGEVRAQRLLLPVVVDLPRGHAALLEEHAAALARIGVELEGFGGGAVLVRALPALLGAADPTPLLRDLADELEGEGLAAPDETRALDGRLDAVIARMACHGSIRAGRRMTTEEMSALLRQMEATPRAGTCSHGRPTWLKLTRAEIERLFGRR